MHDDAEVERVARLMHATFCEFHDGRKEYGCIPAIPSVPWDKLKDGQIKKAYLVIARAVLADLNPRPLAAAAGSMLP